MAIDKFGVIGVLEPIDEHPCANEQMQRIPSTQPKQVRHRHRPLGTR
ncbi:hypothetical protein [Escherichia coli]